MKKRLLYGFITFGLTALIGVGAFAGLQHKPTKETMAIEVPKKYAKITPSVNEPFDYDKYYYLVAKNYAQNGEGVFYQNSITLDNSAICAHINGVNSQNTYADFDLIKNDTITRKRLLIGTALNSGVYKLENIYLSNTDYSNQASIYYAGPSSGYFRRENCAFIMTHFGYFALPDSASVYYSCINQFFDVYELQENYFDFAEQINFYSPYAQDISSYYVNDATMITASSSSVKTILENTNFYSGGYVFDTIRLRYQNAISTSYIDDNGTRQVWSVNGFASFTWVEYVNSVTNLVVVVNERIYNPYNSGNTSGYVLTKASKWISKHYSKIQFFDNVSDITITNLSKLNNSSYTGGYSVTNNDIGIGSAFTLIGSAFTAWLPILGVSVIPGITLGTLIFLPLIAGVIILIIWIVKR